MKVAYVDSSVIVALFLGESIDKKTTDELNLVEEIISSNLIEAEVFATAKRESIDLNEAKPFINPVSLFTPDRKLAPELDRVFGHGYCKGADAYHLACALYLSPNPEELLFLTLDNKQKELAKKIGFPTL